MTPDDKRKAIEYLVYDVYAPELNAMMVDFLKEYGKRQEFANTMSQIVGCPVGVEPVKLRVGTALSKLVDNLCSLETIINGNEKLLGQNQGVVSESLRH